MMFFTVTFQNSWEVFGEPKSVRQYVITEGEEEEGEEKIVHFKCKNPFQLIKRVFDITGFA